MRRDEMAEMLLWALSLGVFFAFLLICWWTA